MKKRLLAVLVCVLTVTVFSIVAYAYQFGSNSQTIGNYKINGYIYTLTSSTVGVDTVSNVGLSSTGVYSITARVVGYTGLTYSYTDHPNYTSVSSSAYGNISSFGSHSATSSAGSFNFNTPY